MAGYKSRQDWERVGQEMTKQEYIRQVVKRLHCSQARRSEIARQLSSDMDMALGEGRQLEEILAEMGMPEVLAKDFNDNFGEEGQKWVKSRRIRVILAVMVFLIAVAVGFIYWALPRGKDINDSKVFEVAQVHDRAEEVVLLVSREDESALDRYLSDEVREALRVTPLKTVKQFISEDWGEFRGIGNLYMTEISQMGKSYAVVQLNASYENVSVTFTLSFNEDMELYGFYVK